MKHVSRRAAGRIVLAISTGVSAALLVLSVATTVHWYAQPHSDHYSAFTHWAPTDQTRVALLNGLAIGHQTDAAVHNSYYPNIKETIGWHAAGFEFRMVRQVFYPRWMSHGDNQTIEWGPVSEWELTVPGWVCICATAILPAISLRRLACVLREKRARRGLCLKCGYDLRASGARCPECGTVRPVRSVLTPDPSRLCSHESRPGSRTTD